MAKTQYVSYVELFNVGAMYAYVIKVFKETNKDDIRKTINTYINQKRSNAQKARVSIFLNPEFNNSRLTTSPIFDKVYKEFESFENLKRGDI